MTKINKSNLCSYGNIILYGSWFLPQQQFAICMSGKNRGEARAEKRCRLSPLFGQSEAAKRGAGAPPAARPCSPTGAQGLMCYIIPPRQQHDKMPGPSCGVGFGCNPNTRRKFVFDLQYTWLVHHPSVTPPVGETGYHRLYWKSITL